MCVAFPGKILEITGGRARVDFAGTLADVSLAMVDARVGDYVLVHAGMAIQAMGVDEAESLADLFAEAEAAAHE
ncbi:HypC/HybG/HupF family hydrogenase formation chaperone [Intestinibacillus massiliensis]|uniref:HypC/HybG/HupF family hydrogenase formation chaperone n=1 Tax=Intestinibacillus massiliensis TaxID=1871029 RepID=UPI000B3615AE|nr:HypC/HybG/HupF family hydrogenase formation chaperone [Intestinibacillus massiliensis]